MFSPTTLAGLMVVTPEKHGDDRGFFARLWCAEEFSAAGCSFAPAQISASYNAAAFTLRGLHWQAAPHGETKLVRAACGKVFDVAVDLRPGSPTRLGWFGIELDAEAHNALLIPAGFAHGFLTLTPGAELLYLIDVAFVPGVGRGARYDDPAIGIAWPRAPAVIAGRDLGWPAL